MDGVKSRPTPDDHRGGPCVSPKVARGLVGGLRSRNDPPQSCGWKS